MKKLSIFLLITMASFFSVFAIEWPQEEFNKEAIQSYFGQNLGNSISTSLIFKDPSEVKAINDGKVPCQVCCP